MCDEVEFSRELLLSNDGWKQLVCTPMASRASSPLPRDKNESDMTHFNGPIVKCSESEEVSTSTGLDHVNFVCKFCRAVEVLHAIAILSCGVRKGASQNFVVSVVYENSAIAVVKTFFSFILLSIHVQLDLAIILATAPSPIARFC